MNSQQNTEQPPNNPEKPEAILKESWNNSKKSQNSPKQFPSNRRQQKSQKIQANCPSTTLTDL